MRRGGSTVCPSTRVTTRAHHHHHARCCVGCITRGPLLTSTVSPCVSRPLRARGRHRSSPLVRTNGYTCPCNMRPQVYRIWAGAQYGHSSAAPRRQLALIWLTGSLAYLIAYLYALTCLLHLLRYLSRAVHVSRSRRLTLCSSRRSPLALSPPFAPRSSARARPWRPAAVGPPRAPPRSPPHSGHRLLYSRHPPPWPRQTLR